MIVIHAVIPLDPDSREEGIELASDLAERSREEPGMIDYRVATDVDDPNVLRFFERYEDGAALEAHATSDHFEAFEERLPDLLGGKPEVTQFEVESASPLEL